MKKIVSLLFIALLGAVACNKQFGPEFPKVNTPEEGTPMTIHFSIPTDILTKGAMSEQPSIKPGENTLHVFVFNAVSGALLQVSEAELDTEGSLTQNTIWNPRTEEEIHSLDFTAMVNMGSAPRHLHFVVDAPTYETDGSNYNETGIGYADGNKIYIGDSETAFATKLYTTDQKTAFWQRIYLANGLTAYTYPGGRPAFGDGWKWIEGNDFYTDSNGNTVNVGDYVDVHARKITDGRGYIMSADVAELLRYIPMVRNFVQVKISQAEGGNFVPKQAALVNVPKSGFVVPYSSASGFVDAYLYDDGHGGLRTLPDRGAAYVAETGYTAPVPNDEIDTACPDESQVADADENGVISLFMFERGKPSSNPTQMLVKGSLNGAADEWFKIDITDAEGNYVPFYRDMIFPIEIGALTGVSGYREMEDAYKGPSIGNPSSSPETATLTQVSDGKGVRIWVDFIDYSSFEKTVTDPETGEVISTPSVRLRYKFWDNTGVNSSVVKLTVNHSTGTGAINTTATELTGAAYSGTDTQDEESGWYYVDVPLQDQGATLYRSVLHVSGTGTNSAGRTVTLYRDVIFSVLPTQRLTVSMSPVTTDAYGQNTTATISLPTNIEFGISMFPLVIRIEAYNGTINPTDVDLPVEHGVSTFSKLGTDDELYRKTRYFWFNKTISWEEYHDQGLRSFEAHFMTIKGDGQNSTTVLFTDDKGHFFPATAGI